MKTNSIGVSFSRILFYPKVRSALIAWKQAWFGKESTARMFRNPWPDHHLAWLCCFPCLSHEACRAEEPTWIYQWIPCAIIQYTVIRSQTLRARENAKRKQLLWMVGYPCGFGAPHPGRAAPNLQIWQLSIAKSLSPTPIRRGCATCIVRKSRVLAQFPPQMTTGPEVLLKQKLPELLNSQSPLRPHPSFLKGNALFAPRAFKLGVPTNISALRAVNSICFGGHAFGPQSVFVPVVYFKHVRNGRGVILVWGFESPTHAS